MRPNQSTFDWEKAEHFARRTAQQVVAAMNVNLSHLGDQLGLYQHIRELGAVTSDQLAEHTGLHERWIREWLRHQACNSQLDYHPDEDKFSISEEAAAVLCDSDHPLYFAGGLEAVAATRVVTQKLPEIFKSGIGFSYDDHGGACACGVERMNNYVPRFVLVPQILPEISGLVEKLEQGITVADVGCGSGIALLHMAEAFPNSSFLGYDISRHALKRARAKAAESGLENAQIIDVKDSPLPRDHSIDFISTFDVVHDVPFPNQLIDDIYQSLKPDGIWLCSDIRSFPTFKQNLEELPHAAIMYGFSLHVCMSSALSEEGGAGLGTLGFNIEVAKEMASQAGFKSFQKLDYENPVNNYYEIRP